MTFRHRNCDNNSAPRLEQEQGGVLILFAISLLVMVAFVGMAIDLSLLFSTKEAYERSADGASLAALSAWQDSIDQQTVLGPIDYNVALAAAVARAKEITGRNLDLQGSVSDANQITGFRVSSWRKKGSHHAADTFQAGSQHDQNPGLADGVVVPGIWYFAEPVNCINSGNTAPNCCDNGKTSRCFESITAGPSVNSFQVIIHTTEDNPLKTLFNAAGLLPGHHQEILAASTSSVVPRRGLVAFDITHSATQDTHLEANTGGILAARAAFQLRVDASGMSNCLGLWQERINSADKNLWNDLPANRPSSPVGDRRMHFKDDYKCIEVTYDAPDEGNLTQGFAVDVVTQPEPLGGILVGITALMEEFVQRSVSADRLGIIAFDDQVLESNADGIATRVLELGPPSANPASEYQLFLKTIKDATQSWNLATVTSLVQNHFLIPRSISYGSVFINNPDVTMSDVNLAVGTALGQLGGLAGQKYSENFILLFSDGRGNCVANPGDKHPDGNQNPLIGTLNPLPNCFNFASNNAVYNSANAWYMAKAFTELYYVKNEKVDSASIMAGLAENSVTLHTSLFGTRTAPHHLVLPTENGCLADSDVRALAGNISFVDTSGNGLSWTDPYHFPNALYYPTRWTGGIWKPIQTCCGEAQGLGCRDVRADLNPICVANSSGGILPSAMAKISIDIEGTSVPITDYRGRTLCSIDGQGTAGSIADLVGQILNQNPYILVE